MATHYKKTCIATLFFGCILLPMDPPTQKQIEPISIITLLDRNILYFGNEIAALDDKITRTKSRSREHLSQQLEDEKSELQKLLELNQLYKQQQLLDLEKLNRTLQDLAHVAEQSKNMPPVTPTDHTHQFTYPEVTPFPPINVDLLVQNTENNIMRGVDRIVQNQGNDIVTEMAKVTGSYQQDIEMLNEQIEMTTKELEEKKKNFEQKRKYALFGICAGIPLLILCSLYVTKYFFPQ